MNESGQHEKTHWSREPYVWLLIAFPLSAVIGGIITTWLAIQSWDGLVVDDYYKRGLEINRTLERDRAAEHYGLESELMFSADSRTARIRIKSNEGYSPPDTVRISFLHATRGGHDQHAELVRISPDLYETDMPDLIRGDWYIMLEARDWRLLESITVP